MGPMKITETVIQHSLFSSAHSVLGHIMRNIPSGIVAIILGPTQAGKSVVLEQIYLEMLSELDQQRVASEGRKPYVMIQIKSTREGRVRMGWLLLRILKALDHPMYMHMHEMDECNHYIPTRNRSENAMALALDPCIDARQLEKTILDEAHLLTRSDRPDLRGNLLESLKSSHGIQRALILCSGYELVYKGLFDSPHFAGRSVFYEFGQYRHTIDDELHEWRRILKAFAAKLPLARETLLDENADILLRASQGVIGLMAKWLWLAKQWSDANHKAIDLSLLRSTAPPAAEQFAIAKDIAEGKHAMTEAGVCAILGNDVKDSKTVSPVIQKAEDFKPPKKCKPFCAKPKRRSMNGIEVVELD